MILFTILILIIFFSAKRVDWISVWYKRIIKQPYNYYTLFGLLIIGFFTHLDYNDRWGCIVGGGYIFDFKNILFSSISIFLILTSFLIKPRFLKLTIVLCEFTFWIFKLFYFKGGYVVGYAAAPDPIISFYDSLTLVLRIFIISGLLKSNIKTIYIPICTLIIMAIKVFGFPVQLSMIVEGEKSKQRVKITKEKLIGDWIGTYEYDSTYMSETIHIKDSVRIRFDKEYITLFDDRATDSIQLKMEFYYEFNGYIHNVINDWRIKYNFWIRNISADSLDFTLTQSLNEYRYKMIRKTPPNTQ